MDRAREFYHHAVDVFGDVAKDPRERVLRFLEEAIELAQAAGIERRILNATADRVYSRDPGIVAEEVGQSLVTLELVALTHRVDMQAEANYQLQRFKRMSPEHWQERQARKKALGLTADA